MKSRLMIAISFVAIAVMVIGMIGSGAWFSTDKTVTAGTITSGTLSLSEAGFNSFSLGTISNMAPGDKTQDITVQIENTGNIPLFWLGDLEVNGSPLLKEAIYIDYAKMEFLGGNWTEPDDTFIQLGKGAGSYPGWYNTLASANTFGLVGLNVFDGNNGMGVAPYEFMGALKPAYAYKLTLRFGFAEAAGNPYMNQGPLTIKFNVHAMQVNEGAINAFNSSLPAGATYLFNWATGTIASQN